MAGHASLGLWPVILLAPDCLVGSQTIGMAEPVLRPRIVTVSAYLLCVVAGLAVANVVMMVRQYYVGVDAYESAVVAGDIPSESFEEVGIVGTALVAVVLIAAAIVLLVVARLNLQGKKSARSATWVLGGIALCCPTIDAFGAMAHSFAEPDRTDAVQRRIEEALPGWWQPLNLTIELLMLSALLLALTLLVLPPANRFFRTSVPTGSESPV
jgi:hypothetical protein